ncbi:hypothetical protein C8A01DRAFT_20872 [Parachaetomium inaequale]|uniref:Uncharacterized protein n=1 Tax=Parachaetomium inaequale TaxID=2588326 RepID=A0AAN6SLR4_9PEZI|nr:hypothetical protein C8A01DRAFT_20872 [Parachaetomium inaequale]
MSTSKQVPQHPLEQPAVIRALVESQTIPWQDMAALCLANKAVFRLVYREEKRHKIKHLPFSHPQNPLRYLIETNSRDGLDEALKLAEFDRDTTSPNGRLLHDEHGDGVNTLMRMCIDHGASRCFDLLITWADDSAVLFNYDCMAVHEHARRAALRHGTLNCLLYMHDGDSNGFLLSQSQTTTTTTTPPPLHVLYTTLLQRARSPQVVVRLARRMPEGTDYIPILAAQCGNRYSHPALVEALLGLIMPPSSSESESEQTGAGAGVCLVPAVCAAASVLHVNALDVLLRRGGEAFAVCKREVKGGVEASAEGNPLFRAVVYPLPGKPELLPATAGIWAHSLARAHPPSRMEEEEETEEQQKQRTRQQLHAIWRTETEQVAAAMKMTIDYLVDAAEKELRPKHPQLLADILDHAAMVYLFNVRTLLLSSLPWLFDHDEGLRAELLVPATADSLVRDGDGQDEFEEAELAFIWRKGLPGKWVEERLWEEGVVLADDLVRIWLRLVTPTTVGVAWRYLKVWPEDVRGYKPLDLLWELLVAEERGEPVE